ncbi:hypothetical protein PSH66_08370 [Pseudomonas sp. FP597]|uniref:hypothetical protein n=1 Tax=Pseudomonas sp. FP597 TaxID=2954096 RepID=UPI002736AB14|nr:hypothetical protein [Pseudomonas sp. FP597]WLI08330.1 hypothetical protein PSH66_08370 [Pseudomonas sp. FP597]
MTEEKKGKIEAATNSVKNFPIVDYAEALFDACVESEVLKEIPVVSTAMATVKTYLQFREGRFKKKVEEFVKTAGEFTADEWNAFSETLKKENKKEQFINELLEVIERADSDQKAKILGGVFRRLVKQEFEYANFEDQVRFTNDMLTLHIHNFMHFYHNSYVLEEYLGDILVSYRMAKRKVEIATKTINMLADTKEQYIKISYEITGIGFLYLATLHQVYKDKIEPRFLYVGERSVQ